MKKNITILIVIIIILISGCTTGSYSTFNSKEFNDGTSFSMEYSKFNGNKSRTVKTEKETEFSVNISTESGQIDMTIEDKSGNVFYEGNNIPTSNFTVTVKELGEYIITILGHDHKGSYKVTW